jgi:thiamine biosynthesis lipoprotein
MGTTAHVTVTAPEPHRAAALVDDALARLHALHDRWSRFEPGSEVSRLNAAGAAEIPVSRETLILLDRMVTAWELTHGAFDPTVLPAMVAAGYDRDFAAIGPGRAAATAAAATGRGGAGIAVDWDRGWARLPPGVAVDPGGIGKGLAADLVTAPLMAAGATGVCVNVGGDARVVGRAPGGDGWRIAIDHPIDGHPPVATLRLTEGAVASSWRTRRAWGPDDDRRHHLVDPATGRPAWTGLAGVTVVAATGWWAEALAKAAFLAGPDGGAAVVAEHRVAGFLVRDDGAWRAVGDIGRFVA